MELLRDLCELSRLSVRSASEPQTPHDSCSFVRILYATYELVRNSVSCHPVGDISD